MPSHPQLLLMGQRLRALREARGLSQENFALEAGIARSYYGGIERGLRNVAALNLIRIAAALGVEVGELFPDMATLQNGRKRRIRQDDVASRS
jgi:transcriptional regulator with XRE-family HTH domain